MIAAVLEEIKRPLVIEELIIPNLDYGQILVEIKFSGICGRQVQEIFGYKGNDNYLPHLLGHEGGGVVKKIGPGVSKCKNGDHVILHWRKSKGIESKFPKYQSKHNIKRIIGGGLVTTFSNFSVVSENRLTVIPKSLPLEVAALLGCSLSTALGLVNNEAKLKIGQSVVIIGAGSVGLNLIQACKMVSAYPIISVDIKNEKLKFAKKFGSSHFIDLSIENFSAKIKKILGSEGPDVIIDTVGNNKLINEAYSICGAMGKLILVGQPKHNEDIFFTNASKNFKGVQVFDSLGGKTDPDQDFYKYARLIESNNFDPQKIITDFFIINDINKAIKLLSENKIIGKALLKF